MALINCPDCGREVSDRATSCIHCGAPLNEKSELIVKLKDFGYVYPFYMKPYDIIGLFDENDNKIVSLRQSETKKIPVNRDMYVSAYFLLFNGKKASLFGLGKKTAAKPFKICAGKTTRLQISAVKTKLLNYIAVSEVDMIDSE
ncbi:MAG: zinc ribbon domain-containing protein [Clostridia bacterium]|nr:zinc ribbon domain-containing protein [Clostridia bacterium]